jgi:hypothetical protein
MLHEHGGLSGIAHTGRRTSNNYVTRLERHALGNQH